MAVAGLLRENELAAVNELKRVLAREFGLVKLVLYGSKARRDSDAESDIDVLIVLDRPCDWQTEFRVYDLCFDIGLEHDVLVQPVIYSEAEYVADRTRATPFYRNVVEEGMEL